MKDLELQLDAILNKHQEIEKKLSNQANLETNILIMNGICAAARQKAEIDINSFHCSTSCA